MELPAIRRAAELHQPRIANAFYRTVEAVRASISLDELAKRMTRSAADVLNYLDLATRMARAAEGVGIDAQKNSLKESLQNVYRAGAEAGVLELKDVDVQKAEEITVGAEMSFDLLNPAAVEFIRTYSFNLIREISTESREAIRDIVLNAFLKGGHPYEQARLIRGVIGLTKKQTLAVTNFMNNLIGGPPDLRQALGRALRDRRFDSVLRQAIDESIVLSPEQIQRMSDRYYERFIKYRAETIARTESLRASNSGAQQSWSQAIDQNLLDSHRTRQRWIVAHDERLCDECNRMPKLNEKGVEVGGSFVSSWGPVSGPPLHPRCRCTIGLFFLPRN
jgi:hypothetical protein